MLNENDYVEILLVEDSAADAELTIHSLKEHNLANRLVWLKDGSEALDFVFGRGAFADREPGNPPRVVLLDLRLPREDGMSVLREIRADERTKGIPVVVLSSSREDEDVEECYRLGANSYISKPVRFEEFMKVVGELGLYWLAINRPPT